MRGIQSTFRVRRDISNRKPLIETPPSNYNVTGEPRRWQQQALKSWIAADRRGIVRVVTGGGKTYFALMCIEETVSNLPDAKFAIVVPSLALADQWHIELRDGLGASEDEIHHVKSGRDAPRRSRFLISVINTARTNGTGLPADCPGVLIVDECHRAGAPLSQQALHGTHQASLGLSATPEREQDNALVEALIPNLGPIIFDYGYPEARRDGVITTFGLTNVKVPLTAEESETYDALTKKIGAAYGAFRDGRASDDALKALLRRRSAVSARAKMRVPVTVSLIEQNRGKRAVIFHESIDAAEEIAGLLNARKHNVTTYHSKISPTMRRDNLRLFRNGRFDVLICCRALDEGMNVPETEIGLISSSTASNRQRIQRLGRVLRPAKGKDHAEVMTLYATDPERERLEAEEERLDGTAQVKWSKTRLG